MTDKGKKGFQSCLWPELLCSEIFPVGGLELHVDLYKSLHSIFYVTTVQRLDTTAIGRNFKL